MSRKHDPKQVFKREKEAGILSEEEGGLVRSLSRAIPSSGGGSRRLYRKA